MKRKLSALVAGIVMFLASHPFAGAANVTSHRMDIGEHMKKAKVASYELRKSGDQLRRITSPISAGR